MIGIKELLEETFIDVPDEKYDVLDEMAQANEDLQNQLNDQIRKNVELVNENTARQCAESFMEISGGLTDTEVEKLATLAEGIEFVSEEDYKEKLNLTKKKYFSEQKDNNAVTSAKDQFATVDSSEEQQLSPIMENYVKNISKILKK
jgi:hypothetical protein